jgi:hypothetical protein
MLIGAIFAETMAWVLGSSALINLLNCACKRPLAPNFFQFQLRLQRALLTRRSRSAEMSRAFLT